MGLESILSLEEEDKFKEIGKLFEKSSNQELALNEFGKGLKDGKWSVDGSRLFRSVLLSCKNCEENLINFKTGMVREIWVSDNDLIYSPSEDSQATQNKILSLLYSQLEDFSPTCLLTFFNLGLECLQDSHEKRKRIPASHSPFNFRWLDAFAKTLTLLGEKNDEAIEDDMKGPQFKTRQIKNLTFAKWHKDDVISLTTTFRDIPLTPSESDDITRKITTSVAKMDPHQLPPLVYQLLLLCGDGNADNNSLILSSLQKYFETNITQREEGDSQDSLAHSEDIFATDSRKVEAAKQAEGTVIFHVVHGIRMGLGIHKDVLKIVKTNTPEIILNPFMVLLSLSASSVKRHKSAIIESVKSAVVKSVVQKRLRAQNAWFRDVTDGGFDIFDLILKLMKQTIQFGGWDLFGQGCMDLAICLLETSRVGLATTIDDKTRAIWDLGTKILVEVVKRSSNSVTSVIKLVTNRITYSHCSIQYTECLRLVIKSGFDMLRSESSVFTEMLEQLPNFGISGCRRVIISVLPLIECSRGLRDNVIMILRKSLFSPKVETRQLAVVGVIQMLKRFKIKSSLPMSTQLSQSSMSMGGYMSQFAANVHRGIKTSNESLCTELMGVLKRGFSSHARVKLTLYQGLYDVICKNPELCLSILDMLHHHAFINNLYEEDAFIDWSKMIGEDGEVKEPIGWFLHCVQLSVMKGQQLYHEEANSDEAGTEFDSLEKLANLMEKLTRKYIDADLVELDFEKNANYNKGTVGFSKVENLKNVYEALMEYNITHGVDVSDQKARNVINLFRRHQDVNELLTKKNLPGGGKAKKAAGEGGAKKVAGEKKGVAENKNIFTVPEIAISLKSISIILRAILIDYDPDHASALKILRESEKFMVYILKTTKEKLVLLDKSLSKIGDDGSDVIISYLVNIGSILVNNLLHNKEANESLLYLCGECLLLDLNLIRSHFPNLLNRFFTKLDLHKRDKNPVSALFNVSQKIMERISSLQDKVGATKRRNSNDESNANDNDDEEEEEETDVDKTMGICVEILTFLFKAIPTNEAKTDREVMKVIHDWVKKYAENCCGSRNVILKPVLNLYLTAVMRVKPTANIFSDLGRAIKLKVGDLSEEAEATDSQDVTAGKFNFIDKDSAYLVYQILYNYLSSTLDATDTLITRCRQLASSKSKSSEDDESLANCEGSVNTLLARIANTMTEISRTRFATPSATMDLVVKLLIKFYNSVTNVAKYLYIRCRTNKDSVSNSKFDTVIRIIGKDLTEGVYKLINYIENAGAGSKRNAKNRVAKDARIVPLLIFRIEHLEKELIKLIPRCKINLVQNFKISTCRDFRISKIENEITNDSGDEEDEEGNEDDENVPNAESTRLEDDARSSKSPKSGKRPAEGSSPLSTQNSILASGTSTSHDDPEAPPSKKLKVKMNFSKNDGKKHIFGLNSTMKKKKAEMAQANKEFNGKKSRKK